MKKRASSKAKQQAVGRSVPTCCSAHRFTLVVKGVELRKMAEIIVLSCFAKRDPDGCEFHLLKKTPPLQWGVFKERHNGRAQYICRPICASRKPNPGADRCEAYGRARCSTPNSP